MIVLRPTNLHWIAGKADDPKDLCAHSGVEFRVGEKVLVSQADGDWTVSAAALYLLRTLAQPHTKNNPVGDHLFPCCGHAMYDVEGADDVVVCGCLSGVDLEVVHAQDTVVLTGADGCQHRIGFSEWRKAVCQFSDVVQSFYDASSAKQPFDEEGAKGFRKFRAEWARRRALAG